jgi:hypothetical protein
MVGGCRPPPKQGVAPAELKFLDKWPGDLSENMLVVNDFQEARFSCLPVEFDENVAAIGGEPVHAERACILEHFHASLVGLAKHRPTDTRLQESVGKPDFYQIQKSEREAVVDWF